MARLLGAMVAVIVVIVAVGLLILFRGRDGNGDVTFVPKKSTTPSASASARSTPTPSVTGSGSSDIPALSSAKASPSAGVSTSASASAPAARPPVTVLNNSSIAGLATKRAAALRAQGWTIASVGNQSGQLTRTTIYYGTGQADAARALAAAVPGGADLVPGSGAARGLTLVVTAAS